MKVIFDTITTGLNCFGSLDDTTLYRLALAAALRLLLTLLVRRTSRMLQDLGAWPRGQETELTCSRRAWDVGL